MPETETSGWQIWYETRGDPGRPAVLLVPGATHGTRHWGRLPELLAEQCFVLTLDMRGFGRSDRRDEPYGIADLVADLVAVLDDARVAAAYVLGHALGASVAQEFALTHPERTLGLALSAASHHGPDAVGATEATQQAFQAIKPGMERRDVFTLQYEVSAPGWRKRDREGFEALLQVDLDDPPRRFAVERQRAAVQGWSSHDRLAGLRCPTLVIHGELDGLVPPENGRQIASLIPGAQLDLRADRGHMPAHEEPERLAALLLTWIASVEAASPESPRTPS